MSEKEKASGQIGVRAPADAPMETSQPLTPERIQAQLEVARRNEKVLPPFNPQPMGVKPPAIKINSTDGPALQPFKATPDPVADPIKDFFGSDTVIPTDLVVGGQALVDQLRAAAALGSELDTPDPLLSADVDQIEDVLPELSAEDRARMPAASNSESPSRGMPATIVPQMAGDKWDGIAKGGFSDVGDAEYFPLDGSELIPLVKDLAKKLTDQVVNDLRFSIARTYPRLRMRLVLEVEGAEEDRDQDFQIEKIFVPKGGHPGGTALQIARQRADQIVFVVTEVKQEFDEAGQSETPPDQIRAELGLPIPHKQQLLDEFGRPMGLSDVTTR